MGCAGISVSKLGMFPRSKGNNTVDGLEIVHQLINTLSQYGYFQK